MSTTVEIKGEFETKIKRLIDAGLYGNIAEAVRDALAIYFGIMTKKR